MRIALIGCGNIGSKRLDSVKRDKGTKVQIIIGKKKPSKAVDYLASKMSKKFNCKYSNQINDALKENIQSVILSTQPEFFMNYGKKILNAKKNLLIEKPLGLNSKQAKLLTSLARKNKVYLKTGFNLRFDDGIMLAKKLLTKKNIGRIYFFKIEYVNGTAKSNKNGIGSMSDIGSHSLNLFEYFISKNFKIMNNSSQKNEYFKDDNGFITIKSANVLGFIHHSFVRWENKFFLEISGEKGSIIVDSLPKWGKQTVILSKRLFPSGKPKKKKWIFTKDNSWYNEWNFFEGQVRKKNFKEIDEGYITMRNIDLIKSLKR